METDLNAVIIGGIVQRPHELRHGKRSAVWGFTLENRRVRRDYNGGDREDKTWVDVVCFGTLAEHRSVELNEGSPVLVNGRLSWDSWTDKNTGEKRYKLQVIAESITRLPEELSTTGRAVDDIPF